MNILESRRDVETTVPRWTPSTTGTANPVRYDVNFKVLNLIRGGCDTAPALCRELGVPELQMAEVLRTLQTAGIVGRKDVGGYYAVSRCRLANYWTGVHQRPPSDHSPW